MKPLLPSPSYYTTQPHPGSTAIRPHARQGDFDLVVGNKSDVEAYLNHRKKNHDPFGQLSLNANVVESATNFEYVPPNTHVLNSLVNYIDFDGRTRNGASGEDAAFVYPLKQKSQSHGVNAKGPIQLGFYADNRDLQSFLNYSGAQKWNTVVKKIA